MSTSTRSLAQLLRPMAAAVIAEAVLFLPPAALLPRPQTGLGFVVVGVATSTRSLAQLLRPFAAAAAPLHAPLHAAAVPPRDDMRPRRTVGEFDHVGELVELRGDKVREGERWRVSEWC